MALKPCHISVSPMALKPGCASAGGALNPRSSLGLAWRVGFKINPKAVFLSACSTAVFARPLRELRAPRRGGRARRLAVRLELGQVLLLREGDLTAKMGRQKKVLPPCAEEHHGAMIP